MSAITATFHLAQVNVARMRAPVDDPLLADFVAQLDAVNGLADRAPGFIWRLQTGSGNATEVRAYEDPLILFNLSVWESVESLRHFVVQGLHAEVMRDRRKWFEKFERAYTALWWIPTDTTPTVAEARARLQHLDAHGPSPRAFTFAKPFPPAES